VSTATLIGILWRSGEDCSQRYLTSNLPDWAGAGTGVVAAGSKVFISGLSRIKGRFSATLSLCMNLCVSKLVADQIYVMFWGIGVESSRETP
jgi:hypothetical protein